MILQGVILSLVFGGLDCFIFRFSFGLDWIFGWFFSRVGLLVLGFRLDWMLVGFLGRIGLLVSDVVCLCLLRTLASH